MTARGRAGLLQVGVLVAAAGILAMALALSLGSSSALLTLGIWLIILGVLVIVIGFKQCYAVRRLAGSGAVNDAADPHAPGS